MPCIAASPDATELLAFAIALEKAEAMPAAVLAALLLIAPPDAMKAVFMAASPAITTAIVVANAAVVVAVTVVPVNVTVATIAMPDAMNFVCNCVNAVCILVDAACILVAI